MKSEFLNFLNTILLAVITVLGTALLLSYFNNIRVWNEIEKHTDEFVVDWKSDDARLTTFYLYDEEGEYICEVMTDARMKQSAVFYHSTVIASSFNIIKSKKLFRKLYDQLPSDYREQYKSPTEIVLEKMK